MSNNKKVDVIDSLSAEDVAKQCGRSASQVYQALRAGQLNEAQLPQWVEKKGILSDQKLVNYIKNCRRLDENKKNKPVVLNATEVAAERLRKKKEKAERAAEQVAKQQARLDRMEKELTEAVK